MEPNRFSTRRRKHVAENGQTIAQARWQESIQIELCGSGGSGAARQLGDSHRGIKIVMRWTGASERTAKYWCAGTRGPTGEHLASLVRHSDAVLAIFLQLTGREASALAIKLADARVKRAEMLVSVDQLLNAGRHVVPIEISAIGGTRKCDIYATSSARRLSRAEALA